MPTTLESELELRETLISKCNLLTRQEEQKVIRPKIKKSKGEKATKIEAIFSLYNMADNYPDAAQVMADIFSLLIGEKIEIEPNRIHVSFPYLVAVVPTKDRNGHQYPIMRCIVSCYNGGAASGYDIFMTERGITKGHLDTNADTFRFATLGEIREYFLSLPIRRVKTFSIGEQYIS